MNGLETILCYKKCSKVSTIQYICIRIYCMLANLKHKTVSCPDVMLFAHTEQQFNEGEDLLEKKKTMQDGKRDQEGTDKALNSLQINYRKFKAPCVIQPAVCLFIYMIDYLQGSSGPVIGRSVPPSNQRHAGHFRFPKDVFGGLCAQLSTAFPKLMLLMMIQLYVSN